ncbi:MAG: glycosyltransferase, partial [Lactobacillales bacterium]|nr:glycosyltransferase [Lactobacillales bacterium]
KKISVVLASFNGEKYLKEQLESIFSQLDKDDELIITDDGSTDKTFVILKPFLQDSRTSLLKNHFLDFKENFAVGIKKAKNEVIVLSDQDDVWHPERLKETRKAFNEGADILMVAPCFVDEKLQILSKERYNYRLQSGFWPNFWKNSFIGACMAFRRELAKEFLPFPSSIDYHDSWIALLGYLRRKKIVHINRKLVYYRRYKGTFSGKRRWINLVVKSRFFLFINLLKRWLVLRKSESQT